MSDREFMYKLMFKGSATQIERTGELTRCKDCEYHRNGCGICDIWHAHTNPDGYCHRGRKYGKTD